MPHGGGALEHEHDTEFDQAFALIRHATMVDMHSARFVYDSVRRLHDLQVEGDLLEAGVWKGGMSMLMALAERNSAGSRKFVLMDTFDGLPAPTADDDPRAKQLFDDMQHADADAAGVRDRLAAGLMERRKDGSIAWNLGSLEEVRRNMASVAPAERVTYIQGRVEDTLDPRTSPGTVAMLPAKLALLRLDTDFYSSTKAELDHLWERLSPGGLLIVDDYRTWGGARRAVDEWLAARGWRAAAARANPDDLQPWHLWKVGEFDA